MQKVQTR